MKRILLLVFVLSILSLPASGQLTIIDSPFLYKPTENYNDCDNQNPPICFIDTVVTSASHRDVPIRIRFPRGTTGRLPLILWSHGGGPNEDGRAINITWGRTLARAGYIVVHMSHRPWEEGDRIAACKEFAVATQEECQAFPMLSLYRPRDANVVLGALDTLEQTFPQLNNRIDRNNIAVAGWSYGSFTVMTLAGARIRFSDTFNDVSFMNPLPKVFLAMSPQSSSAWGYKADSWREITRPVLFAFGAGDYAQNDDPPARAIPFQSVPRGRKYELYITHPGSIHETFNLENENFPHFNQWVASYSLAYLDAYLKNRPAAQSYLISNRLPLYASRKVTTISRK